MLLMRHGDGMQVARSRGWGSGKKECISVITLCSQNRSRANPICVKWLVRSAVRTRWVLVTGPRLVVQLS
jgi:hypothetical protein